LGSDKPFSALMCSAIPDLALWGSSNGQFFPRWTYRQVDEDVAQLDFSGGDSDQWGYDRVDNITDEVLAAYRAAIGDQVDKDGIFYYVYGLLHSPAYRATFAVDLKKSLPRLPLVAAADFWAFSRAGRALADLHLHYENVPPHPDVIVTGAESGLFRVEKMRHPAKGHTDTILYNSRITLSGIPAAAYDYIINGKSAIAWVMERYQLTTHKESCIVNDPNTWADENGNPRYILDLLLSVIHVSTQTVALVDSLPKLTFAE